ncbi:hypothetical protein B566_EDAN005975 [Ephemera danica]|nr:hypothetical protein B566_EDAN005975 [Ephemera danica]
MLIKVKHSYLEGNGDVGVEVVAPSLKAFVRHGSYPQHQVPRFSVHVRFPLGHKSLLLAVSHTRFYLHLKGTLLVHQPER